MKITPLLSLLIFSAVSVAAGERDSWLVDSIPQTWIMTPQTTQTLPTDDSWWLKFNDPLLNDLIKTAVANNYDVAAALKRIEMANQIIKETQAGYFPAISLSGGWNRSQNAGSIESSSTPSSRSSYFSLGASMNWEIDLFGRIRSQVKAKKASYNASRAEYDGVMVSLCANVATAYMQLRTYQRELEVAERHIASQERVLKITEARYEADLGDMLEVTQAKIVLYNTQAAVPTIKTEIRTLLNTIAVLIGEFPGTRLSQLREHIDLPDYVQPLAVGVPADLLRRRPDIVEAEMNLAQYAALVGVAKKDFLPTLSLTGSIGTEAHHADNLFGKHSLSYSIAPQLSWTLFDGLARKYRTAEAKLQLEAAVDQYNLTVETAVKEVDNALLQYDSVLQSIDLQKKVVEESEKSLHLSVDLYKSELTAFSNVVDAQMNWLDSQNKLVELEGNALTSLITIYQALGGGFQTVENHQENMEAYQYATEN